MQPHPFIQHLPRIALVLKEQQWSGYKEQHQTAATDLWPRNSESWLPGPLQKEAC